MKTDNYVSEGKKRMGMVKNAYNDDPPGQEDSPAEESQETPEEESQEGGDSVEAEAQSIVDSIGDNHELCMAVYGLLKTKYEKEQKDEKKGSAAEPQEGSTESYDEEGMPSD